MPRQRGNVAVDNHTFVNALLWMCRTGAPWRDLPECYGKWVTVYQRFDRWSGNGATCISSSRCFVLGVVTFCWTSLSVWSLVSVPDGFRRRARAGCVCP